MTLAKSQPCEALPALRDKNTLVNEGDPGRPSRSMTRQSLVRKSKDWAREPSWGPYAHLAKAKNPSLEMTQEEFNQLNTGLSVGKRGSN